MGRITSDQSVGGMSLGEEAAVMRECSLLKIRLGIFLRGMWDTVTDQLH